MTAHDEWDSSALLKATENNEEYIKERSKKLHDNRQMYEILGWAH